MKKKITLYIIVLTVLGILLGGCAAFSDFMATKRGDLIGQKFEIFGYDNFGNETMTVTGSKINIGLYENEANQDSESNGFKSEVLDILVDGSQLISVGTTLVFQENGIDMITNFDDTSFSDIDAANGGSLVALDRTINQYKNIFGKERVIVISSQLGNPIGLYQGSSVFVTVPDNLPKMTRINIDGKSLYIHRANYQIFDTQLLNQ